MIEFYYAKKKMRLQYLYFNFQLVFGICQALIRVDWHLAGDHPKKYCVYMFFYIFDLEIKLFLASN